MAVCNSNTFDLCKFVEFCFLMFFYSVYFVLISLLLDLFYIFAW